MNDPNTRTSERGAQATTEDTSVVRYSFTSDATDERFSVARFEATEELNRPYRITLDLVPEQADVDATLLLGRDAIVQVDRARGHARQLCGLVARVTSQRDGHLRPVVRVEILPAMSALRFTRNTRIFQDRTALDILDEVLRAGLGEYRREHDSSSLAREAYATRTYCVQYRETDYDFVHRLMEEEGIGYHFEHGERERLILSDGSRAFTSVQTMLGGAIPFVKQVGHALDDVEAIVRFEPTTELTSTALRIRDHDWTRGRPQLEAAHEAGVGPQREVYEHGVGRHVTITEENQLVATLASMALGLAMPGPLPFGLETIVHDVPSMIFGEFSSNDVERQLLVRRELLVRDASSAKGESVVIGLSAGTTFELTGHPNIGTDGEYYVWKITHTSEPRDGEGRAAGLNYQNHFQCLPKDVAWRPARTTPKPSIYGVHTATVTGPLGMDIHTDHHGRIRVRFPWDRASDRPMEDYTCWIRMSQAWAGHGHPGFLFIPRVGMEVIVSFIDGDPDRPIATGCVYNGRNPPPQLLPAQATKSMIRTRTVPHGPGYNELSFEDAMGRERVHVRAQRDLDMLAKNDHKLVVERNQHVRVMGEQEEVVVRDQTLSVGQNRTSTVVGAHHEASLSDHSHHVGGSSSLQVREDYDVIVERGAMTVSVHEGEMMVTAKDRMVLAQNEENYVVLDSQGDDEGVVIEAPGARIQVTNDRIELKVGGSSIVITPESIQANQKTFPAPPPSGAPGTGEE